MPPSWPRCQFGCNQAAGWYLRRPSVECVRRLAVRSRLLQAARSRDRVRRPPIAARRLRRAIRERDSPPVRRYLPSFLSRSVRKAIASFVTRCFNSYCELMDLRSIAPSCAEVYCNSDASLLRRRREQVYGRIRVTMRFASWKAPVDCLAAPVVVIFAMHRLLLYGY